MPCLQRAVASMASAGGTALVSVDWLKQNLQRGDVRVLDASWFLPSMGVLLRNMHLSVHGADTLSNTTLAPPNS